MLIIKTYKSTIQRLKIHYFFSILMNNLLHLVNLYLSLQQNQT